MLQPRRGDGPLIKVAGTPPSKGRCRQRRLRCGESEPFKCGQGRGEGGATMGRGHGVGLRSQPTRQRPLECPPKPPAPAILSRTPLAPTRYRWTPNGSKDVLKPQGLKPVLQEMLQRGKAEQRLALDHLVSSEHAIQGTFLPYGPCGG